MRENSLIPMLGFGYAYKNLWRATAACVGLKPHVPPVLLDVTGAWIAGLVGESARNYYSDYRVQQVARQRASVILHEAAGLKLSGCIDFGNITAGSVFGGEIILSDTTLPALAPVLSSPKDVTGLAVKMDASSLEETGWIPRLFDWRHRLTQQRRSSISYVMRIPGVVTLAEQVCGEANLRDWLKSHPDRMFDLAGMLRRTLIRLVKLLRRRTSLPMPFLVVEDPAMGKIEPEIFHEVFWRATRSIVYSLMFGKLVTWFIARGTSKGHLQYIVRLRSRVIQAGESVSLESIRSSLGRPVVWGHIPSRILREGNINEISNAAKTCVEKARSLGIPLLLSPAGPVEPATPIENIAALSSAPEKI